MLLKKFLIFLFIFASFINISVAETESNQYDEDIVAFLDKSEAYYWAALNNGGYKRLLVESRKNLEEAKNLFKKNKIKLSDASIAQISLQINSPIKGFVVTFTKIINKNNNNSNHNMYKTINNNRLSCYFTIRFPINIIRITKIFFYSPVFY